MAAPGDRSKSETVNSPAYRHGDTIEPSQDFSYAIDRELTHYFFPAMALF